MALNNRRKKQTNKKETRIENIHLLHILLLCHIRTHARTHKHTLVHFSKPIITLFRLYYSIKWALSIYL